MPEETVRTAGSHARQCKVVLAAQVLAFDLAQLDTKEWVHVKERYLRVRVYLCNSVRTTDDSLTSYKI